MSLPTETPAPVEIPPLASTLPPPRNFFGTLLGVLFRPHRTFSALRTNGNWWWLIPLIGLLVGTVLARVIALPIEKAQAEAALAAIQEQMQNQPLPEGADGDMVMGAPMVIGGPGGPGVGQAVTIGSGGDNPLMTYGLPLGSALLNWGLRVVVVFGLSWLVGGRPAFGSMLQLGSWSLLPDIVRVLVSIVFMLVAGRTPISGIQMMPAGPVGDVAAPPGAQTFTVGVGPGGASGPMAGPNFGEVALQSALQMLDVYWVWALALLVIGVAAIAQVKWLKALIPPFGYWLLSVVLSALPTVLMPFIFSLMGGGPMMMP